MRVSTCMRVKIICDMLKKVADLTDEWSWDE